MKKIILITIAIFCTSSLFAQLLSDWTLFKKVNNVSFFIKLTNDRDGSKTVYVSVVNNGQPGAKQIGVGYVSVYDSNGMLIQKDRGRSEVINGGGGQDDNFLVIQVSNSKAYRAALDDIFVPAY